MKLKRFLNASMILAFLAMSQTALAQAFTVQGRVVDESGEPMIGVAVTNKDGNTLGVTDADGRYSIELNSPTKLKFTFVGSETITIDAKKATQKDIVMRQTATALDDVVVVGYGTQKKINLTGAVQSINSKDILRANVSNGSSALQGIVPGLTAVQNSGQPGNDQASLKLRGLGSLNSSTSPLILIDGVEGDFNRIDLNSIETISVLKDAASASIYGSRVKRCNPDYYKTRLRRQTDSYFQRLRRNEHSHHPARAGNCHRIYAGCRHCPSKCSTTTTLHKRNRHIQERWS